MYEQFRNEFITELAELQADDLQTPTKALDNVAQNWTFEPVCTDLAIYGRDEAVQLMKGYIACKKLEGKTDGSLENIWYALRKFIYNLAKPLKDVTTNDMRFYLAYYQKTNNIADDSLEKLREILNGFFTWLVGEEYINKNPMAKIHRIKGESRLRHAVTPEQLDKLRQACVDDRDRAILEFLFSTGARVTELCGVKLKDIDFERREVVLFGKGKKERISYLSNTAVKAIKAWLENRPYDSEYLFNNIRGGKPMSRENIEKIFRRLSQVSGLSKTIKVTPHVIRHTTATQALDNGMPIEEVQKLLGHAKISTTMIYIDMTDKRVRDHHREIFD